jgi:hypothetical protein
MGRRKRFKSITMTTLGISTSTLEVISKYKSRKETQDDLIKRLISELEDLKEYKLDMDLVLKLKDRKVETLQKEL